MQDLHEQFQIFFRWLYFWTATAGGDESASTSPGKAFGHERDRGERSPTPRSET